VRHLIIALPPQAVAVVLFMFFCAVAVGTRRVVLSRCGAEAREDLVEQANGLLTGIAATFAFFVGFAITICWGAVTAGQSAVEQQSAAIQIMAWELRQIPDRATSTALLDKLARYAQTAADADGPLLARGETAGLPSAAALHDFDNAVKAFANGAGSDRAGSLGRASSQLISSSAVVAAVANRGLPRPLAVLLMIVAVLVTAVMGVTTVKSGRPSMVFVYLWCLIPALSLTVVWALAYPFALRSGMTIAPLQAVAEDLGTR